MNEQELSSAKGRVKGCWKLCVENFPCRRNYMYKENEGMELAPENLKEGKQMDCHEAGEVGKGWLVQTLEATVGTLRLSPS